MGAEVVIHTLEELNAFLNENGILEIAMRDQKKKFDTFYKVIIDAAQNGQEKEAVDKVINILNKNNIDTSFFHILLIICFHKIATAIPMYGRRDHAKSFNTVDIILYFNLSHLNIHLTVLLLLNIF